MTVLWTVLDNSIAFILLFTGVWLVRTLLRGQLSARLHYVIWAAVLVALLIPVKLDSGINLWNLLPSRAAESIALQIKSLQPSSKGVVNESVVGDGGGQGLQTHGQPAAANNASANLPTVSGHAQPTRSDAWYPMARIDWLALLWAVWLTGMAAAILWLFPGGMRLRRQIIRCGSTDTPAWLKARARECAKVLNMRRDVRIIVQPVLAMPAVMGIFRPILAMPESVVRDGDGERVRHILMHEFSHIRRGDLIVIALLNLLSAVYWFHPLVWLCFNLIREDMETYCDNDVVNALGDGQRQEYIRTLVYFSGVGGRSRAQAALSLRDARLKMRKRIEAMFMIKKTKPAIAVPVILLVMVLLLVAAVTGCLPSEGSRAAMASPPPTATLKLDTPAAVASSTTERAATNPADAETKTPAPSPSPSATPVPTKTMKTSAPATSQWEDQYKPVLDQYRQFAADISKYAGEGNLPDWKEPWGQIAADVMLSSRNFGYALRDMDSNGTPSSFC